MVTRPSAQGKNHVSVRLDGLGSFRLWADILTKSVPAEALHELSNLNIPYEIIHDNLQRIVDTERQHMKRNSIPLHEAVVARSANLSFDGIFNDWQSYETLSAYMASLAGVKQLPSIGNTYENRTTNAFSFGSGPLGIVYHGGSHAREWIAPATVAFLTNQLITNYTDLLELFTFYVIPVTNPDGYEYTRDISGDRYHRKNMQPNEGSSCIGTDVNRNFNYQWGGSGSSSDPCADDFGGPSGFSSPEAFNIANFVAGLQNIVGYVDFHSYSELIMFSNGYTCDGQVKDYAALNEGAQIAMEALKSESGETFGYGAICPTIYQASGSANDYMYNVLNITYSYSIELRPNQNDPSLSGNSGFNPDPSNIVLSGREITAAMVALWRYVAQQLTFSEATGISKTSATTAVNLMRRRLRRNFVEQSKKGQ
ncbi:corticosteroid- binding protein [Entophlyctis luteolus]|nr:corticosteroid- binding protein [Entophlyctis luteolus]